MLTTTIFFAFLTYSVAAQNCEGDVLFSPDVFGRKHTQQYPCSLSRCRTTTSIEITKHQISYYPPHSTPGSNICPELYVIPLSGVDWPVIIYYPETRKPSPDAGIGCLGAQFPHRLISGPRSARRDMFFDNLQKITAAMTKLRDYGCTENTRQPIEEPYLNPWLEGPITYLRTMAHHHDVCLRFSPEHFSFGSPMRC